MSKSSQALLGAFVGDAASMGLHWVAELVADVGKGKPEFLDPPATPFYKVPKGSFTPYGDQETGTFNADSATKHYHDYFSGNYAGYRDECTRAFLENFGLGKRYPNLSTPSNEDANAFTKVVPLAALCHNASNLPQLLADAIQLNQSHPTVVAHGVAVGLFLSALVGGASPSSALAAAKSSVEGLGGSLLSAESASSAVASLQEAEALVGKSHEEVLEAKGRHCNVINQTISSVQLVLQGKSYVEAVRETIRGGGDNGSRAVLVGACVAAVGGGVPVEWVDSSVHAAEIKKLCKE